MWLIPELTEAAPAIFYMYPLHTVTLGSPQYFRGTQSNIKIATSLHFTN